MFHDELTDRVASYTRITRWLVPLSIVVGFLVFVAAGNISPGPPGILGHVLIWGCAVLGGGFLLSIPFVFIEHWKCGFTCLATAVLSFLLVVGVAHYPMMRMEDGCSCGMARSWYEWGGRKLKFTVVNEGNPAHPHKFWDAQQGFQPYLPW